MITVGFAMYLFSRQNIPSNTNTMYIYWSLSLSGRNIPPNTNAIHIHCCLCVVFTFRPEYSVQYKYNTHSLLLCCINFPAGIFRQIQIQYTCIVHSYFPAGIFRPIQIQYTIIVVVIALFLFPGRNIPSKTNTIHIDCF